MGNPEGRNQSRTIFLVLTYALGSWVTQRVGTRTISLVSTYTLGSWVNQRVGTRAEQYSLF